MTLVNGLAYTHQQAKYQLPIKMEGNRQRSKGKYLTFGL